MNSITTSSIQLTKKEYFKILTVKYFKKKWWIFAFTLLLSFFALSKDQKEALDFFIIIMGFTFPFYMMFFFWRFAYSKENKIALLGRSFKIEEDQIIGYTEDGTVSQIKLKHVVKTYKTNDFAMLYLSQATFIYLPKYAFTTEIDYKEVIHHIESKIEK